MGMVKQLQFITRNWTADGKKPSQASTAPGIFIYRFQKAA
jgi:hypothetical protein